MNPICFLTTRAEMPDTYLKMLHDILIELQVDPESCPVYYTDETPIRDIIGTHFVLLNKQMDKCTGLDKVRGNMGADGYGRYYLETFGMDRINKEWRMRFVVKNDINKFLEYDGQAVLNYNIKVVNNQIALNYMQDFFAQDGVDEISYDIETEAGRVQMISVCGLYEDQYYAWVVPMFYQGKHSLGFALENKAVKYVRDLLQSGKNIAGHNNWYYDNTWLWRERGMRLDNSDDTMVMMNIVYPELPKDLNFARSLLTPYNYYDDLSKSNRPYYCAMDSITTLDIYRKLKVKLVQSGRMEFYQQYRRLSESGVLFDLNNAGIATMKDNKLAMRKEYQAELDRIEAELGINVNSPQQIIAKVNSQYKYKKDQIASADGEVLARKAQTDLVAMQVCQAKGYKSMIDNYLSYYLHDGRTMVGTAVCFDADGRIDCTTDAFGYGCEMMRDMPNDIFCKIMTVDPGKELLITSMEGFEWWIKRQCRIPIDAVISEVDMAIITMQPTQTVARLAECKVVDVQVLEDKLNGRWPDVTLWQDRIVRMAKKRVVTNRYGRVRNLMISWNRVNGGTYRDVIQYLYESETADGLMFGVLEMQQRLKDAGVKVDWLVVRDGHIYAQYDIKDRTVVDMVRAECSTMY